MRRPAIVMSVVAHAGLCALVAHATLGHRVTKAALPKAPEAEPIEVVMLAPPPAVPPELATAMPVPSGASARVRATTSPPLIATTATAVATEPDGQLSGAPSGLGLDGGLLRMRHDSTATPNANLTLDPHSREELPGHPHTREGEAPEGEAPLTGATSFDKTPPIYPKRDKFKEEFGKLENTPGGGAVINDRVTTVTMNPDGTASFADKPDIDIKVKLPIPHIDVEGMRQDAGKLLTEWFRDPYAGTRFGPKSEVARHLTAVPGTCDSWGDLMCADPLAPESEQYAREQKQTNGSLLGGPMDITAWLHRKFIGDPYASRKRKLLDMTRDERIARGGAFRGDQLAHSAEMMTNTLNELWTMTAKMPAAEAATTRKEALFELWDDCAEPETESGSEARAEAGARARAIVVGWIRAKLPAGSADAFTDEEIAKFDARRASKQRFTPY